MPVRNKLFERIRYKELELGHTLSISDVSAQSGVTRATLYAWLNKPHLARFEAETITKLCRYFNCQVGDLLVYEDEQQSA